MKVRDMKVAVFENADHAVLQADVNNWTVGKAVSASATFAAGFITEQELVAVLVDGDRIVVVYSE